MIFNVKIGFKKHPYYADASFPQIITDKRVC